MDKLTDLESWEDAGVLKKIHSLESRYTFESDLMDAVAAGQLQKTEKLATAFFQASFPPRTSDPLRNIKNYCIILNTLLRKAAQRGGVHPAVLDPVSSGFGKEIELLTAETTARKLMVQMAQAYCRLVRKHATKLYSPSIQRAITCIDADLRAKLTLRTLAQTLNISSSYLSTLFKKETGQTLTEYIHHRRMEHAMHLLKTTNLQVQTVAQYCGMEDVHYFSKMFKKLVGISPREYRLHNKKQSCPRKE